MSHSTFNKPERLYVIVHDYVRESTQAYPAERRCKLAMCRELGLVRAVDPKAALERANQGAFCHE